MTQLTYTVAVLSSLGDNNLIRNHTLYKTIQHYYFSTKTSEINIKNQNKKLFLKNGKKTNNLKHYQLTFPMAFSQWWLASNDLFAGKKSQ